MTVISTEDANPWRSQWHLRPDTVYLNHGSFGPPPHPVQAEQRRWRSELDAQPMDFFCRRLEPAWFESRGVLARFLGTRPENLAMVDNATYAMNVVAASFPLQPRDEVLLTDHEYGAVLRIWKRACAKAGAEEPVIAELPLPAESPGQIIDAIASRITDRTRMIVVSHITSPTAWTLPVAEICAMARRRGIAVCVDGPHALVQLPVDLDALDCDFYTASCHKWLCAPFGSGFLYVSPRQQAQVQPPVLSWGRLPPTEIRTWDDDFAWIGTRDPSAFLAIKPAIEFIESVGLETFRQKTHSLARYARQRLVELTRQTPWIPDSMDWYVSMASVPLPPGNAAQLQDELWRQYQIEVPIVDWKGQRSIRVSCHLYNDTKEIDALVSALAELL